MGTVATWPFRLADSPADRRLVRPLSAVFPRVFPDDDATRASVRFTVPGVMPRAFTRLQIRVYTLGAARLGAMAVTTAEPAGAWRVEHREWLDGARSLAPESVDVLYADPPFNTGRRQTDRAGSYEDAWDSVEAYTEWLEARLRATIPALKPTGCVLLHCDWRTSHHARLLLDRLLGADRFVNHLVWRYGLGGSSPRRFARKHDDILFYAVDPGRYWFEPPMVPSTSRRMNGRPKKATDVLDIPADRADEVLDVPSINNMSAERTGWPTQKPLALLRVLVGACCPPEGTVLDPCCGSGTTLAAARELGRHAVGFDADGRAVEIARSRLQNLRK